MADGRTDGGNNAFADAGNDRFFTCTADKTVDIDANGDFCLCAELNAVLCNCGDNGCFDNFGTDAHLNCGQNIPARKVNCACLFKIKCDARTLGGDERIHNAVNIAARKVMRFHLVQI